MTGRRRRWACRECGNGIGGHKMDCNIGRMAGRGQNMGITAGGAEPDRTGDGTDVPLTIHPDAPLPASIENTHTEQAVADAAAIDRAYGD